MKTDLFPISNSENLLCFHRNLKDKKGNIFEAKTSFTVEDLWKVYVLSCKSSTVPKNLQTIGMTRLEREELKESIAKDARQPTEEEIAVIKEMVAKYGLDTVLYAIDELSEVSISNLSNVMKGIPNFENVYTFIDDALSFLNRLKVDYRK